MKTKWLAVGIILLFVGVTIAPAIAQNTEKQSVSRGTWFYVGGSEPGNYSRIQDAVDNASDGDTVFVYNGTYTYKKHGNRACIDVMKKNIDLVGEDKNTTILDAEGELGVVHVDAEVFNISGFTIKNSEWFGVEIGFNYNKYTRIFDNIIYGHKDGIIVWNGICYVYDNIVYNNSEQGIFFAPSNGYITNNTLYDNNQGVTVWGLYNLIYGNIFGNNSIGLFADGTGYTTVQGNHFEENGYGVAEVNSKLIVIENNFIDNIKQAYFGNGMIYLNIFLPFRYRSIYRNNYWDDWKLPIPRPIRGEWAYFSFILFLTSNWGNIGPFPTFQFDRRPAMEPYNIPGVS